ncbi:MAG: DUF4339 domain-containing protein [Candidatus Aenigmatarchaeota archaeon]
MEKEFYYLDEKEQKGPFTIDQLKSFGLKPDTLVWTDGFKNWKPVKEVEELKFLLKKTPPPPPIVDNSTSSIVQELNEKQEDKKILVEDSNVKFWATFKIYAFSLLLLGIAALGAFLYSNSKIKKHKDDVYSRIDKIFDGKTVVLDGTFSLPQGETEETNYNSKTNKKDDDPFAGLFKPWWEREKLYTIFKANSGGFTIKQLTKRYPDGFDVETITSGDMGYKKPTRRYIEPKYMDFGWSGRQKIGGGYWVDNWRLSVRECYREAYEFFTKDDRYSPGAYTPGKYIDIINFSDIRNDYFFMDNTEPKEYSSSGMFSSYWYSSDDHGANINTEDWAVYYSKTGRHYVLTPNKEAINKDLFTYLSISLGSVLVLLIITGLSKPKYFRNLRLYGKRWKNNAYNDQIFFFEHSFFGKHTFTEIINDKVSKGILKITDSGNTLNLSYPNKELFYKIGSLSQDNLTLISLKDKTEIFFTRVGSKEIQSDEIKENEQEIKTSENEETV